MNCERKMQKQIQMITAGHYQHFRLKSLKEEEEEEEEEKEEEDETTAKMIGKKKGKRGNC